MKIKRSMVLVSNDPLSIEKALKISFNRFSEEIKSFGLQDEISLSMVSDIGRSDAAPL